MLGSILGDIIGSTYEFANTKDYNFDLFPAGSNYTDDSILTIAVADAISTITIMGKTLKSGLGNIRILKALTGARFRDGYVKIILNHTIVTVMVLRCG